MRLRAGQQFLVVVNQGVKVNGIPRALSAHDSRDGGDERRTPTPGET
jgi:hypothetical protein